MAPPISPLLLLLTVPPALPSGPEACPELAARLRAPRRATVAELRQLLDAIGAEYPNDMGQFIPKPPPPPIPRKRGEPPPPPPVELDWATALATAQVPPALLFAREEALDLLSSLRALGETKRYDAACPAARLLLDFAFEQHAGAFRDEVGRTVRRMGDAALPPLIRLAFGQEKVARGERRYANYQLDRMDRQRPETVTSQVRDDRLRAEILRTWGETRPPSAVHAVLGECNASSLRVRKAARFAWLEYVTRKPTDPPKRKLKIAGGKETEEEKELYLSSRDLADQELRRQWPALMSEPDDPSKSLLELSQTLFARQDAERTKRWDVMLAEAEEKRRAGDSPGAVAIFSAILAQDPFYARRSEMVPAFTELSSTLASQKKFDEAALWLRQARALADERSRGDLEVAIAREESHAALARKEADPSPLQRWLALSPGDPAAQAGLSEMRWRKARLTAGRSAPYGALAALLLLGGVLLWRRA